MHCPPPILTSARGRLGCALLALFAAATMIAAPRAAASDNFVLANETLSVVFDQLNLDLEEEGCWYDQSGAFAVHPETQGEYSVVVGNAGIGCENRSWEAELYYEAGAQKIGALEFVAHDPFIGASSLRCAGAPQTYDGYNSLVPIERFLTMEVDGDSCKVNFLPGVGPSQTDLASVPLSAYAGHVRLVSSLARVNGGKAKVMVEVFGLGDAHRRVTVALRDAAGQPIGEATRVLLVGDHPRTISVPLSAAMRKTLAAKHELRIHAAVDTASPGGTGDTTRQLLLSTRR